MKDITPDEFEYATSDEGALMMIQAIKKEIRRERLKTLIPAVVKELMNAGVDFSKVDYEKLGNLDFNKLADEVEL